jgi:hypothetical protein
MNAKVRIDAGICGFTTRALATCEDGQHVTFHMTSDCEKVRAFAGALANHGPIDAFQEINPAAVGVVLSTAHAALKGCCAACAAPVGAFKALQVAAGLALPKDIQITLAKEE